MWRKLLLVVLLLGIGYLIWRRMQSRNEEMPSLSLTPPASPPPAPPTPPTPAATPSTTGPRPVVTRVHRGEPPKMPPPSPPSNSDAPATPRPVVTRVHRGAPPERRRTTGAEGTAVAHNGASATNATTPAEAAPAAPTPPAVAPEPPAQKPAPTEAPVAAAPTGESGTTVAPAETAEPTVAAPTVTDVAPTPAPGNDHEEEAVATALETAETTGIEPIDLNRADREALLALPGIGPVLADRIIAYREAHGPFKSVDELTAIAGIGERNINTFRKLVYVAHD